MKQRETEQTKENEPQ